MSQSKAINCYYLKDVCKKTKDNTKGNEGFGEIDLDGFVWEYV
jgi:hypothetical protein